MKTARLQIRRILIGIVSFLLISFGAITAQYHENLMFGVRLGVDNSHVTNITNMLVNEENKPMYSLSDKAGYTPAANVFTHYRFKDSQVAVEGSLTYNQIGAKIYKCSFFTSDVEQYNIKYQYVGVGLYTKVYLYRGLMMGVGIGYDVCLNSSSGISYQSSMGSKAQNLQSEEHIRQALKGRANLTVGAVLGYEFKFGMSMQLSYLYGLADLVETGVNPYKFTESSNNSRTLQLTVGWAISTHGFYL